MPAGPDISPEDLRNGWTVETLAAYRRQMEIADGRVPGLVATEYDRPPALPTIVAARDYDPHKWGKT